MHMMNVCPIGCDITCRLLCQTRQKIRSTTPGLVSLLRIRRNNSEGWVPYHLLLSEENIPRERALPPSSGCEKYEWEAQLQLSHPNVGGRLPQPLRRITLHIIIMYSISEATPHSTLPLILIPSTIIIHFQTFQLVTTIIHPRLSIPNSLIHQNLGFIHLSPFTLNQTHPQYTRNLSLRSLTLSNNSNSNSPRIIPIFFA